MSPLFNAVGASGKGCCKPLRVQRYNIFLICTNLFVKIIKKSALLMQIYGFWVHISSFGANL